MEEYKEDIISTRKGCLGSSDAKMLQTIAVFGSVPKSAQKRLAILKGFVEQKDITTQAMKFGDMVEQSIYEHICAGSDKKYQSNPRWESKKYSRHNVKCIDHPDIVLEDETKRILYVWEVKASKLTMKELCDTYRAQILHHLLLAKERVEDLCESKAKRWSVKVMLVHYDTNGIDLDQPFEFDPSRMTIKECRYSTQSYNLAYAMDIVSDFLETFDYYTEDEEIDAKMLPTEVYNQFMDVAAVLKEIKDREAFVEDFKNRLYSFFASKGIKKVSCDDFSFTLVFPTSSVSVDYKTIFEKEIAAKHPRIAKALVESHKKVVNRKGYVQIKTRKDKDEVV